MLLAALIAVQLAIIFRAELLARVPQARDALVQLCAVFGCAVGWPTQVDQLAVIGSELQTIPGTDVLELTAVDTKPGRVQAGAACGRGHADRLA